MKKCNVSGNKYTVRICTDYVTNDPKQTQQILDRVSTIISNSYRRMQYERVS